MDIEKKNLIRKIIGALVNAFFLPGLGQVIVGRVKKGVGIIGILIFLMFCIFGGVLMGSTILLFLIPLFFFGIIVVSRLSVKWEIRPK